MIKFLASRLFGIAPSSVRYCERDGSIYKGEIRAEELRARTELMLLDAGSGIH